MDFYNKIITELYRHPTHAGELTGADVRSTSAGNPGQSDVVQLQIIVKNDNITQACFKAHGAMTTIAAAEYLCQQIQNKTIQKAANIGSHQIKIAMDLPAHHLSSAHLVTEAWQKLCQV
jgi:NifU-like protein involved in Fe-S cluster formation